ncbi:paralemmin [Rhinolophus ferrumequinum]|uniref:Paralemmin-1 n=1 Tax=Rhinolophus ferrumequinum TaxID=59479 RepID=A0A7J7U1Y2_RHIFE|nr:paralemmin [Rhinolophus ferrumequinum]
MEVLVTETTSQQERLQAIAEKRKRQAEMDSKRRQLEDDRRQLQHLKSKALRERWLLEGTPSSTSEGDEDMRRQMQEDEQKARVLEESISRLEKEIEVLEKADVSPATNKENMATPSPAKEAPPFMPQTPAAQQRLPSLHPQSRALGHAVLSHLPSEFSFTGKRGTGVPHPSPPHHTLNH